MKREIKRGRSNRGRGLKGQSIDDIRMTLIKAFKNDEQMLLNICRAEGPTIKSMRKRFLYEFFGFFCYDKYLVYCGEWAKIQGENCSYGNDEYQHYPIFSVNTQYGKILCGGTIDFIEGEKTFTDKEVKEYLRKKLRAPYTG